MVISESTFIGISRMHAYIQKSYKKSVEFVLMKWGQYGHTIVKFYYFYCLMRWYVYAIQMQQTE